MGLQRFDGFPTAYETGNNAGTFLAKAADSAANFACGLYKDYPGAVIPASQIISLNPSSNMVRGVWDGLCAPRGMTPPPPVPAATGGQCKCTVYNWTSTTISAQGATPQVASGSFTGRSEVIVRPLNNTSETTTRKELWSYNCTNGVENGTRTLRHATSYQNQGGSNSLSITRPNNAPDTCGNQPPTYPPSVIPPARNNTTTNINLPGVTIPIGLAYAPISIQPTLNLSPTINVDVGGLQAQFDLGGVTIGLPEAAPRTDGKPSLPIGNRPEPGSGGGTNCPPCPTTPIKPTPGDPVNPPTEGQPTTGEDEEVPGLTYLEVVITKDPDKRHFGDGGQNVYFAGWVAFRAKSGAYYPREQINFRQSVFKAPEGSDGYTLTFTNGAEGRARLYTEQPTT